MSLSEELQDTEGPDLFGLLFPDEDAGDDDLFFSDGNNLMEDLLSDQDVSTALRVLDQEQDTDLCNTSVLSDLSHCSHSPQQ